jgi:hypothetical protein
MLDLYQLRLICPSEVTVTASRPGEGGRPPVPGDTIVWFMNRGA